MPAPIIQLPSDRLPRRWFNLAAHLPQGLPPPLGPDGQPLPFPWPDANGMGPDGQPWRGGRRGLNPSAGAAPAAGDAAPVAATADADKPAG